MLKLDKKTRDEIVAYLSTVVVPATIGSNLMTIAKVLSDLKEEPTEVAEEKKEDETKS